MGPDAMILVFSMLSFKPSFSLSFFSLIKRLFHYCSLSAIRVVSSTYLRLLIFPPAVLIPACDSSSLAFCMMHSAYTGEGNGYPLQYSGVENYLYAEYMMRNARLDESQAGIKIDGRNVNNLIYADDTTLMAES